MGRWTPVGAPRTPKVKRPQAAKLTGTKDAEQVGDQGPALLESQHRAPCPSEGDPAGDGGNRSASQGLRRRTLTRPLFSASAPEMILQYLLSLQFLAGP